MCGICGVITRSSLGEREAAAVRAMNAAMKHRGPDDAGELKADGVLMAMRRLSIIDLEGSRQPLWNEDGTIGLVANGEIYNYRELRRQLQQDGHTLRTQGDCETIIHLYEQSGPSCVSSLRGMFAFALWDARRRRVFLARDRMGEKPLYLFEGDGFLLFASELRAMLRSGLVRFDLDPSAVNRYFYFQYVPEPRTPVRGVRKLDAGHIALIGLDPWDVSVRRYWSMEDAPAVDGDPGDVIRRELETVARLVVRSDVPVGVSLSGGMDSSAVAALAAKECPGTIHAFSVGYAGRPAEDERSDARRFADHLGIAFHEVEIGVREMVDGFPDLVGARDDPIADVAGCGYFAVSRLAREHGVPVLLQGQGGDELFWGYPWVRDSVRRSTRRKARGRLGALALPLYARAAGPPGAAPWQLRLWLRGWAGLRRGWEEYRRDAAAPPDRLVFYEAATDYAEAARETDALYAAPFRAAVGKDDPLDDFAQPEPGVATAVRVTRLIADTYLREDGVAQGDRLSMASSVEMRLPLLDYRLVETVIGLRKANPGDHRLAPKTWLREAVRDVLPAWVMDRPKRGFQPPMEAWFRELFRRYGSLLADGYLVGHGVLDPSAAARAATCPLPRGYSSPLCFKALVLEMWCRCVQRLAS